MEIEWDNKTRPVSCSHYGAFTRLTVLILIYVAAFILLVILYSKAAGDTGPVVLLPVTQILTGITAVIVGMLWLYYRYWKNAVIQRSVILDVSKLLKAGVELNLDLPSLPSDTLSIMTNQMLKNWAITANDILIRADQIHVDSTSKIPERYKPGTARK